MSIPTPRELLSGWAFVERRYRLGARSGSVSALERACSLAEELAGERPGDVPAAFFYALLRYPRSFGGQWIYAERTLVAMLHREGRAFVGSEDAVRDLRLRILEQKLGWPEVCEEIRAMTADPLADSGLASLKRPAD